MSLQTIEVAHQDWTQALNAFSAIHEGWLVSLDILSPDIGAQPAFTDLPLVGVSFEKNDGCMVTVATGRSGTDHFTHPIQAPSRIWIERTGAGDAALEVESADGTKTILRLKTAALPETVDGIVRPTRRAVESEVPR